MAKHEPVSYGAKYHYQGRLVEPDGPVSPTQIRVRVVETGEMLVADISALVSPSEQPAGPPDLNHIDPAEWNWAKSVTDELRQWASMARAPAAAIDLIAAKFGKSKRQVQRYLAALRENVSVSSIVREAGGRPRGILMLDPRQEAVITAVLRENYLIKEPENISNLMIRIDKGCEAARVKTPSESAVRDRMNALSGRQVLRKQKGSKAAKEACDPVVGHIDVPKVLSRLQIDHTPVDKIVVTDDEYREPLGRPWLSVAIDVFSRCILGFYISMDSPSILSTALCICHAVLPKDDWFRSLGVTGYWPMYGQAELIHVDNGADFRSHPMVRGCNERQIELEWRPVGGAHYGGHIERLCGTLNAEIHALPGTTFSNPAARGDYDSEKESIMTMTELREWLIYKICYKYHTSPHSGLGERVPLRVWEEGIKQVDPHRSLPIAEPLEFMVCFLPSVWRPVRRYGVEWNTRPYWNPDLEGLIGSKEHQLMFYDPRDIRVTYMRNLHKRVVALTETTGKVSGPLSLAEDQLHRKLVRDGSDDESLRAMRHMGITLGDSVVARAKKLTKKARNKAAREKSRQREVEISRKAMNLPEPKAPEAPRATVIPAAHRFGKVEELE